MDDTISGKAVIITGGGRGLGKAMAIGLVSEGANVAIKASREGSELEETAKECRDIGGENCVLTLKADVSSFSECKRVVQEVVNKLGGINILINNAGRGMTYVDKDFVKNRPRLLDIDANAWNMIVDTKATLAVPTAPRDDHVRQQALYSVLRQKPATLVYASHKKSAVFELDEETIMRNYGCSIFL